MTTVLDEYDVVAVDNEGVYITDEEHYWKIGGDVDEHGGNKLKADYLQATQ